MKIIFFEAFSLNFGEQWLNLIFPIKIVWKMKNFQIHNWHTASSFKWVIFKGILKIFSCPFNRKEIHSSLSPWPKLILRSVVIRSHAPYSGDQWMSSETSKWHFLKTNVGKLHVIWKCINRVKVCFSGIRFTYVR